MGFVDLTYRGQVELRNRETLLEEGFIYSLKLTSATGMPVDLCSDRDLEMGNCDRGRTSFIITLIGSYLFIYFFFF